MIVKSKSGRECIEYHGSHVETETSCDGRAHVWVHDTGGHYEVYASDNAAECLQLNDAMLSAYGAGRRVFSVATRLEKMAREKPALDEPIIAEGGKTETPTMHK
ncbi:MAG: hypothetical protein K6B42_00285 [Clostridia bacterium]|nr:hypothetical protein [Clostridia bacterium]